MNTWEKWKNFIQKRGEIFIAIGVFLLAWVVVYAYFLSEDKASRDVQRYVDLLKINDELKLYYSKNNTYPLPEDAVSITASGEILTYQWYFWEKNFEEMSIKSIQDPLWDKFFKYLNYYTYVTDEKKQKFQLMAWYENDESLYYMPTSKRFPYLYGENIGVAIENKTARPIQETKLGVDVLHTFDAYSIFIDNKSVLVGDRLRLKNYLANTSLSQAKSCLEIKESGWNKNGYYYIQPLLWTSYARFGTTMQVYCDMESDGWGWTRLYYKDGKETCFNGGNNYNSFIIEKLFTQDFAVSDSLETLQSEGSWILKNIDFNHKDFSVNKMVNVANCKTPSGEEWSMEYGFDSDDWILTFLMFKWNLTTLWDWNSMFFWCWKYVSVWNNVNFRIWWRKWHTWEFISSSCSDYTTKDNSITSRWDWNDIRVIWVR